MYNTSQIKIYMSLLNRHYAVNRNLNTSVWAGHKKLYMIDLCRLIEYSLKLSRGDKVDIIRV